MSSEQAAVQLTQELMRFNTFETPGKYEILKYVKSLLEAECDAEVTLYDMDTTEPFLIAKKLTENAEFKILLDGHLDVVSPEGMENPFDPVIKDGTLYGRGSCDMKSGCAAIMQAFIQATKSENPKGDLYLMFSTDEEYAGAEILKALDEGILPKVDFTMIAEPTSGMIMNAHKGEAWATVTFTGRSAHSSIPEKGANAIYMATQYVEKLRAYLDAAIDVSDPGEFGSPRMNVGLIKGGSGPNVVAPSAEITIDIRFLPGENANQYLDILERIARSCEKETSEFKAEVKAIGIWDSLYTSKDHPMLETVQKVICETEEREVSFGLMTGWGEGGYLNRYAVPAVYYGPGEFTFAHTPNEQIPVSSIETVTKSYCEIMKALGF